MLWLLLVQPLATVCPILALATVNTTLGIVSPNPYQC